VVVLLLALVAAIALSIAAGGSFSGLAELRLRGETVLVLVFLCQAALPWLQVEGLWARLAFAVWLGTFPVMALICVVNHRVNGMLVAALGLALNFAVIALNMGMPVSPAAVAIAGEGARLVIKSGDFAHVMLDAATRYPIAADVLPVAGPVIVRGVASVGDLLLVCGVSGAVASAMMCRGTIAEMRTRDGGSSEEAP
jgi:hypothetical protein